MVIATSGCTGGPFLLCQVAVRGTSNVTAAICNPRFSDRVTAPAICSCHKRLPTSAYVISFRALGVALSEIIIAKNYRKFKSMHMIGTNVLTSVKVCFYVRFLVFCLFVFCLLSFRPGFFKILFCCS